MTDPAHPAWLPETEVELRDALDGGLLDERQHLEVKREIPQSRGDRKETAKDLASLAVDGGRLIVGIDEGDDERDRAPSLSPVALDHLPERLEQIALARIDPPLQPSFHPVPTDSGVIGSGYLLVDVPASPQAPHMVDGRYWGRGEKTKHELSDGEVERLIRRRHAWEADIHRRLEEQEARNPIDPGERAGPHMLMVARPVAARDDALAHLFAGSDFGDRLSEVLIEQPHLPRLDDTDFDDAIFRLASRPRRRAEGGALCHRLTEPRRPERYKEGGVKESVFELELSEDGTLRLVTNVVHRTQRDTPQGTVALRDQLVLGLAHHVLACCQTVAHEAGHYCNHDLAVALTGMHGVVSSHSLDIDVDDAPPYTANDYRRATRATPMELTDRPGAVVERLLGPLMRSLEAAQHNFVNNLLTDPTPAPEPEA